jgi:hypothetical protein
MQEPAHQVDPQDRADKQGKNKKGWGYTQNLPLHSCFFRGRKPAMTEKRMFAQSSVASPNRKEELSREDVISRLLDPARYRSRKNLRTSIVDLAAEFGWTETRVRTLVTGLCKEQQIFARSRRGVGTTLRLVKQKPVAVTTGGNVVSFPGAFGLGTADAATRRLPTSRKSGGGGGGWDHDSMDEGIVYLMAARYRMNAPDVIARVKLGYSSKTAEQRKVGLDSGAEDHQILHVLTHPHAYSVEQLAHKLMQPYAADTGRAKERERFDAPRGWSTAAFAAYAKEIIDLAADIIDKFGRDWVDDHRDHIPILLGYRLPSPPRPKRLIRTATGRKRRKKLAQRRVTA